MKDKFNVGLYVFAGVMGAVAGGLFSKSQYHKGKLDAFNEVGFELEQIKNEMDVELSKKQEESN